MNTTFDIKKLFKNAFGFDVQETGAFEIPTAATPPFTSSLGARYQQEDLLKRTGTFMPVIFNVAIGYARRTLEYVVPFAVVGVTCKKTIISTAMPERGGSVKELISLDDYAINIKGIAINDENTFPEEQIIDLHEIFKIGQSISLRNVMTEIFLKGGHYHRVVIKDLKFPQVAAIENARPFEMDCESDMIFTLETE